VRQRKEEKKKSTKKRMDAYHALWRKRRGWRQGKVRVGEGSVERRHLSVCLKTRTKSCSKRQPQSTKKKGEAVNKVDKSKKTSAPLSS
jgi:hypothetical protein